MTEKNISDSHQEIEDQVTIITTHQVEVENSFAAEVSLARISGLTQAKVHKIWASAVKELTLNYKSLAWTKLPLNGDVDDTTIDMAVSKWMESGEAKNRMNTFRKSKEDFQKIVIAETTAYVSLFNLRNQYMNEAREYKTPRKATYSWDDAFVGITKEEVANMFASKPLVGYTTVVTNAIKKLVLSGNLKSGLLGTSLHELLKKELPNDYHGMSATPINKAFRESAYCRTAYKYHTRSKD